MTTAEIFIALDNQGIRLRRRLDKLHFTSAVPLTMDQVKLIKEHKPALSKAMALGAEWISNPADPYHNVLNPPDPRECLLRGAETLGWPLAGEWPDTIGPGESEWRAAVAVSDDATINETLSELADVTLQRGRQCKAA